MAVTVEELDTSAAPLATIVLSVIDTVAVESTVTTLTGTAEAGFAAALAASVMVPPRKRRAGQRDVGSGRGGDLAERGRAVVGCCRAQDDAAVAGAALRVDRDPVDGDRLRVDRQRDAGDEQVGRERHGVVTRAAVDHDRGRRRAEGERLHRGRADRDDAGGESDGDGVVAGRAGHVHHTGAERDRLEPGVGEGGAVDVQ
ncbi:hypothetical protein [Microbacterium elymi]|uniref:Uncharacterized protein n=1 Tax=Microbacterium elymi TaxID=2909587 RepID=A0ABY5NL50_9MICO|nr:hypothetical protein [Microbacterium elymi]UUT35882.1 hypothetical protein L2X98_22250 [Microbacterium elymi]